MVSQSWSRFYCVQLVHVFYLRYGIYVCNVSSIYVMFLNLLLSKNLFDGVWWLGDKVPDPTLPVHQAQNTNPVTNLIIVFGLFCHCLF